MPELKVKLSKGNTKMGPVLSVSLPPIKSCGAALPCFKTCYAAKLQRLRPNCAAAWDNNWKMAMTARGDYFAQVAEAIWMPKTPPGLFRWHVAGDIPDYDYLRRMYILADRFAETQFLAFTKKYDLLALAVKERRRKPANLSIVVSAWPGLEIPRPLLKKFPTAWMRDPKDPDPRIPETATKCNGDCFACRLCWNMKPGASVYFDKH